MLKLYDWQADYLKDLPKNVVMTCDTGTGKTLMAMSHAIGGFQIVVVAPPAKINGGDWQQIGEDMGRELLPVSFGKVAKQPTPPLPYVLVVDEIHYAKAATSQRAKAVIRLATDPRCVQVIGLSATAIPNGYIDLQTYGIIWGWWKNKTAFIREHVLIDRSRGFPRIIGYKGEDKLKKLWNSIAFGLDKSHLRLPDLIEITTDIQLKPRERDTYRMIKNQRVFEDELLDTPAKLHATLRQYLSGVRGEALESILDDTEAHILVFYVFNASRDKILEIAKKYKREVYEQSGHRSHLPQGIPKKPSITILQYQSGSAGLNLQYAPISVFYEPSYSWMDMQQAIGRNYRGGTQNLTRHFYFKVAGTLDTAIYRCIDQKQDFNDSMVADDDLEN